MNCGRRSRAYQILKNCKYLRYCQLLQKRSWRGRSRKKLLSVSLLLTKTKVIDSVIAVILALLGRVTGGAGYVPVAASSFMGALSGSGPGNVMATGSITISAMKKSGFLSELAANIESNASY